MGNGGFDFSDFQNRRLATVYAILAQGTDCQNCGFFYTHIGSSTSIIHLH